MGSEHIHEHIIHAQPLEYDRETGII